ncbi:MAG TPA: trifunctional transcriptional regulator/proline dehydrogenase/L-glutamate gamma-semialdehyde dehydrogenase, partial [Pseudomonas sp.]|nr:trifunctional transcriptional regulator/proline dehydrogenase/L-glutamate gamma-semialdehyde dehydrogenase [Pseudomonas sp.]
RIDETIAQVVDSAKVGNLYVNRNIVGAVVGVQPFGGEGLSGTGPKAGGPLYLYRLLSTRPQDAVAQQLKSDNLHTLGVPAELEKARAAFAEWATQQAPAVAALFEQYRSLSQSYTSHVLNGPTGERNTYSLLPRERVLCLAEERTDLLAQLAATLAVGSQALLLESQRELLGTLPKEVQKRIVTVADWSSLEAEFDAILHHGDSDQLRAVSQQAAQRKGPIIGVHGLNKGETDIALERLLIEHALSVNTAAAGGNASLMTIG